MLSTFNRFGDLFQTVPKVDVDLLHRNIRYYIDVSVQFKMESGVAF